MIIFCIAVAVTALVYILWPINQNYFYVDVMGDFAAVLSQKKFEVVFYRLHYIDGKLIPDTELYQTNIFTFKYTFIPWKKRL